MCILWMTLYSFCYVCLGHFSSDQVEKMFDKLRQVSGDTSFIDAQLVLQKAVIHKAKLCLDLSFSFDEKSLSSYHSCEKCICKQRSPS